MLAFLFVKYAPVSLLSVHHSAVATLLTSYIRHSRYIQCLYFKQLPLPHSSNALAHLALQRAKFEPPEPDRIAATTNPSLDALKGDRFI